ncbi:hypothetical protein, partial [Pseudomonas aeruginosa]|uniref:hypothetical protein n=1 Tax=Pseudomonas aeruginosa TaxID=287 RepID=UPI0039823AC5
DALRLAALLFVLLQGLERGRNLLLQNGLTYRRHGTLAKLKRAAFTGREGRTLEADRSHERAHTPRA